MECLILVHLCNSNPLKLLSLDNNKNVVETWVSVDSPVYASNRIKGKMYLLWKLYFGLFDNATEVPPQKGKKEVCNVQQIPVPAVVS